MASQFQGRFCVLLNEGPTDVANFACLAVNGTGVTRITASYGPEADRILFETCFWLAVIATTLSLLLLLRRTLRVTALFAGRMREWAKTEWSGSRPTGLSLLDSEEDWYH